MLEWSSLYRVTLLLSKINDDSDLDAEAAILYGKVSIFSKVFSKWFNKITLTSLVLKASCCGGNKLIYPEEAVHLTINRNFGLTLGFGSLVPL